MTNAGVFLVQTVFGLYLTMVIIRFMLQLAKADFYNPLAQAVVKLTQPFVEVLQKIMPRTGRFSLATLVLAFLVQLILILVVLLIAGFGLPNPMSLAIWSLIGLASQVLDSAPNQTSWGLFVASTHRASDDSSQAYAA
jgi:YggT family protein